MSDNLIKRSDAIKALYKYSFVSKDVIEREIKAIPTADRPSIDLVRCAECKKVREDGGHANCGGYLYCRKWKTLVDEDCFCSWGERRE